MQHQDAAGLSRSSASRRSWNPPRANRPSRGGGHLGGGKGPASSSPLNDRGPPDGRVPRQAGGVDRRRLTDGAPPFGGGEQLRAATQKSFPAGRRQHAACKSSVATSRRQLFTCQGQPSSRLRPTGAAAGRRERSSRRGVCAASARSLRGRRCSTLIGRMPVSGRNRAPPVSLNSASGNAWRRGRHRWSQRRRATNSERATTRTPTRISRRQLRARRRKWRSSPRRRRRLWSCCAYVRGARDGVWAGKDLREARCTLPSVPELVTGPCEKNGPEWPEFWAAIVSAWKRLLAGRPGVRWRTDQGAGGVKKQW